MRAALIELVAGLYVFGVGVDTLINGPRSEAMAGARVRGWLDRVGLHVPPSPPTRAGSTIKAAVSIAFAALGLVFMVDALIGIARQLF